MTNPEGSGWGPLCHPRQGPHGDGLSTEQPTPGRKLWPSLPKCPPRVLPGRQEDHGTPGSWRLPLLHLHQPILPARQCWETLQWGLKRSGRVYLSCCLFPLISMPLMSEAVGQQDCHVSWLTLSSSTSVIPRLDSPPDPLKLALEKTPSLHRPVIDGRLCNTVLSFPYCG